MTRIIWFVLFAALGVAGPLKPWAVQKVVGLDYPRHALSRGLEGTVVLQCHIANDGKVIRVDRVSGDQDLAADAIRNAIRWEFRRVQSGKGVFNLVYHFQIRTMSAYTHVPRFRFVAPGDVFVIAKQAESVHK